MIVYAIVDDSLSPTSPLGDSIDAFVRREDAERFIEEVRGDDPELASYLRITERELEAGGLQTYRTRTLSPRCGRRSSRTSASRVRISAPRLE